MGGGGAEGIIVNLATPMLRSFFGIIKNILFRRHHSIHLQLQNISFLPLPLIGRDRSGPFYV